MNLCTGRQSGGSCFTKIPGLSYGSETSADFTNFCVSRVAAADARKAGGFEVALPRARVMPIDWSARLDGRGYHATSVSRHATESRFDGPVRVAKDGWVEGDEIIAFDPMQPSVQLRIKVGDAVYMSSTRRGQPAEIARIESFFAKSVGGDIWFYNTFFWRPEQLRLADDDPWDPRELFLQTSADETENSAAALELIPVRVVDTNDIDSLVDAPHSFFTRRTWDPASQKVSPIVEDAPPPPETMDEDTVGGGAAAAAPQTGANANAANPNASPPPTAQAPRTARRNLQLEKAKERISLLEDQMRAMQLELKQVGILAAHIQALEVKLALVAN